MSKQLFGINSITSLKNSSVTWMFLLLTIVVTFLSLSVYAAVKVADQDFDSEPHELVNETTKKILAAIETGPDPIKEPEKFVDQLSIILDPVVAFDYIAKGVMGRYAKDATPDQIKKFAKEFKLGLVNTYGKGMSNFSDLAVVVLPPAQPLGDVRKTVVVQEIRGQSSTNQVSYTMAKNKSGQWKMINVVLNGINLGQTFRGQFAAEVEKNNGDLAATIDNWGKS